jgi:predicted small lipoprotein YifL
MRWPLLLVAALLLAGCGDGGKLEPVDDSRAAEPQRADLDWRESYPSSGQRLIFAVDSLEITAKGWSADIAVTNSTAIPFDLGAVAAPSAFGLMLFANNNLDELEKAAKNGRLPPPRTATRFDPAPPDVLAPKQTWRATISAPGSLADSAYVRVSFGPLVAKGDPPEGMRSTVVWITDRSYRL